MKSVSWLYILILVLAGSVFFSCSNKSGVRVIENPAANGSSLPWLYTDNSGTVFMSWVEQVKPGADSVQLKYSVYEGGAWKEPGLIAGSSSWFVNWADFPSIVAFRGEPVAAHWLRKVPGNRYSYVVDISLYTKSNWSPSLTPHFDSTATEHGFVSMIPMQENNVLAIWLDGRRTANRSSEDYYNIEKAMTLRSAEIGSNGTIHHRNLIDESVCDCCQTSLVRTSYGAIAAYRDRTSEEIRDIYISRYENGNWGTPFAIHNDGWKIGACPVNGPKLAVNGSTIALAWYTRAGDQPAVKMVISNDEGRNFSAPVIISNDNPIGRVDAVVDEKGRPHVSWMEQNGDSTFLKIKSFETTNISNGSVVTVSGLNGSRSSGFPQITSYQNRLLVAWTETGEESVIKTAIVDLQP